jgi:hypothetical protein
MPADAGLCNPSNNESQVFNCALYFATTDDGRQPTSYGRIQANLESKIYTAADNTTFNDIILDGGTLNCPSGGTINVARDFTYDSGAFNVNSCTVQFNGATTQNLTLNAPLTLHHLTVGSGATLVETVAADNATLTGALTNNGMIRKSQAVSGTGALTFGLTAAQVNVITPGTLSNLQVDRVDSNHPNATAPIQTGRYWSITPTGSGYTLDLTLPHNSTPDANDKLCRYTGAGWDCAANSFDTINNTITRTGIAQLSDWATGNNAGPTAVTLQTATLAMGDPARPALFVLAALLLALLGGGWLRRGRSL